MLTLKSLKTLADETGIVAGLLGPRGPSADYAEGDKPEFVAGLVLRAIEEGQAQYRE
jgi:hypothetical protein